MTRRIPRRALPAAAILFALTLTGCTGEGPEPAATAEPSPAPNSTRPPASETPSPAPIEAPAVGATCEDVLTPEAYAKMEADGLEPTVFTPFDPIAIRIADEGGLTCAWGKPQTDYVLTVAQASIGDDATAWTNALADGGYTQTDDPMPGSYSGQYDAGQGIAPVAIVAGETLTFVNLPLFAGWLRPAS